MIFLSVLMAVGGSRPPSQTAAQATVFNRWSQQAAKWSDTARANVLTDLGSNAFKQAISTLSHIVDKTPEQLLDMLGYEIYAAPHIHNLPVGPATKLLEAAVESRRAKNSSVSVGGSGATDVNTVMNNGYIPTVWEELANGSIAYNATKARGLDKCEVNVLKFPEISLPKPSMKEAWDRPVYNAINIWKRSGGNFEYGEIAFVMDEYDIANRTFWSPLDTGWYCYGCLYASYGGGSSLDHGRLTNSPLVVGKPGHDDCAAWDHASFGTHTAWYHLLHPHLRFWGHSLSDLFLRWYGGAEKYPVGSSLLYFEGDVAGSWLVPETLKYMCLQYTRWATPIAAKIQKYAKFLHRPLLWSRDYNSRMILDPYVDEVTGEYRPTDSDRTLSKKMWDNNSTFGEWLGSSSPGLHIHYIDYFSKSMCSKFTHEKVIGVNSQNQCMYFS